MMQNNNKHEGSEDRDINDVFSDIFLTEDRAYQQGYREGFQLGQQEENLDAYHLGYHKGAELGTEIGYYSGFTKSYLAICEEKSGDARLIKDLNTLKILLDEFPRQNNLETDFMQLLSTIRAKFKKVCATLKIKPEYPKPDTLSF